MNQLYKTPWEKYMGHIPMNITYPESTMYDAVFNIASAHPYLTAYEFLGFKVSYKKLISKIDKRAAGLKAMGVKKGDSVIVALPNCPQAIITVYAVNKCGAILNMIHPLSSPNEIEFYIKNADAKTAIILDSFHSKFVDVCRKNGVKNLILTRITDEINFTKKLFVKIKSLLLKEKQITYFDCTSWSDVFRYGTDTNFPMIDKDETAVILYSGGTTGTNKGIMLSNYNMNVLGKQIIAANPFEIGYKMLSVLPLFHGFGLGVGIHAMLINGAECILAPQFNPESFAKLISKKKINYVAGVPSMFDSMAKQKFYQKFNFSSLRGVFSGGDSLSKEIKERFDKFLKDNGADVQIREGYGTTECVNAASINPTTLNKVGSIGIPLPDNIFRIVKPGTFEDLETGETGEIIISGPSLMQGYLNNPEETDLVIKKDEHGTRWLYTGDLAYMDEDGFTFFKGRNKRMIVSFGYNIYPAQVEAEINKCELVKQSCVIGVPDQNKVQKVKAFIVLKEGIKADLSTKSTIRHFIRDKVAKYAIPQEYEFRNELPKTKVGKIAYKVLEDEEIAKQSAKKN